MTVEAVPDLGEDLLYDFFRVAFFSPTPPEKQLEASLLHHQGKWHEHVTAASKEMFSIRGKYLIEKAAEIGNADAQNAIGEMHWSGDTYKQNLKEGAKWFIKAGAQGHAQAIENLANALGDNLVIPERPLPKTIEDALKAHGSSKPTLYLV